MSMKLIYYNNYSDVAVQQLGIKPPTVNPPTEFRITIKDHVKSSASQNIVRNL